MEYVLENEYLTVVFDSLGGSLTTIQNKGRTRVRLVK